MKQLSGLLVRRGAGIIAALALAPALHAQDLTVDSTNGNSPYTVTADATYNYGYIGNTSTGELDQSAFTLSFYDNVYVGYGTGSTGTYNLSGTGNLTANSYLYVGYSGTGVFNQTGGTNTVSYGLDIGYNKLGQGTYTLSGGTLDCDYATYGEIIGDSGTGTIIQNGGANSTLNSFVIGNSIGGSGSYTLNSGTLSASSYSGEYIGESGTGVFTQNGGTNTAGSGSNEQYGISLGDQTGSSGTYNLNGGTLLTSSVYGYSGTSTFNFNGGTLKASASDLSTQYPFMTGVTTVNVQSGGAKIDTNGYGITIAQNLLHDPTSGVTDGGLTKTGAGGLALTGNNTYNGGTFLLQGSLTLTGHNTNPGGTFLSNVSGYESDLTAQGDGALGTGNVTFLSGTNIHLVLTGGVTNQYIAATATLSLHSTGNYINTDNGLSNPLPDSIRALIVNGVYQPAGTYGSSSTSAEFVVPWMTGDLEFLVVPEPSTWALVLGGVGTLMVFQRGRIRRGLGKH
ncbi:MAG: hypothetical protein JO354_03245 [Verrucomicrobia bacterium]|nr:hypothetical protein [Verrucomicrobiota bacterium]